jgi:N-ethylmaleimide reductase
MVVPDNRLRFLREVTEAVSTVFGSHRVGVRFAPLFSSTEEERVYLGLVESDPHATYIRAAQILNELETGYLSIAEADWDNSPDMPESFRIARAKPSAHPLCIPGVIQRKSGTHAGKGMGRSVWFRTHFYR